jgi:hypothetical protein
VRSSKQLAQQAFVFELDPNRAQRVLLAKSVGASRFVYNWGPAKSQRAYELSGRRPRLSELKQRLVELKKGECAWLYEVSAHIGQQALVDLNNAFERFFKSMTGEGVEAGSDSARLPPRVSQKHPETGASTRLSWEKSSQRESALQRTYRSTTTTRCSVNSFTE